MNITLIEHEITNKTFIKLNCDDIVYDTDISYTTALIKKMKPSRDLLNAILISEAVLWISNKINPVVTPVPTKHE